MVKVKVNRDVDVNPGLVLYLQLIHNKKQLDFLAMQSNWI